MSDPGRVTWVSRRPSQAPPVQHNYTAADNFVPQEPQPNQQAVTQQLSPNLYTAQVEETAQPLPATNLYTAQVDEIAQPLPVSNLYTAQVDEIAQPIPASNLYSAQVDANMYTPNVDESQPTPATQYVSDNHALGAPAHTATLYQAVFSEDQLGGDLPAGSLYTGILDGESPTITDVDEKWWKSKPQDQTTTPSSSSSSSTSSSSYSSTSSSTLYQDVSTHAASPQYGYSDPTEESSSTPTSPTPAVAASPNNNNATVVPSTNNGPVDVPPALEALIRQSVSGDVEPRPVPSGKVSAPQQIHLTRDWNDEFQRLLDMEDSQTKFDALAALERDFVYASETYGRIIISEHGLPLLARTIKPSNIGGIAGGEKFIVQGILFKFAKDDPVLRLYNGDEYAMKAASHERNGLMAFYHSGVQLLRVPLMAFIDYRGFRLIATSLLPLNRDSLKYGSKDGGITVYKDNEQLNDLIQRAAVHMNIKGHMAGANADKEVFGPADIEGHVGTDGRFYLLDFARLAPPEPPSTKGSFLYKLLRLELVRKNSKPLSSDAFSGMGRHNAAEHNDEVRQTYNHLIEAIIPETADAWNNKDIAIEDLSYLLHSAGINIRHIGRLRAVSRNEGLKKTLLMEGVIRTMKAHVRGLLRAEMRRTGVPSEDPYRRLVIAFLNIAFGGQNITGSLRNTYWDNFLIPKMVDKFTNILPEDQRADIANTLPLSDLLKRLCAEIGIRLSPEAFRDFSRDPDTFQFVDPDLLELDTVITRLNIINYCEGMALFYKAQALLPFMDTHSPSNQAANRSIEAAQARLLSMARQRLERSLDSTSSFYEALLNLAKVVTLIAKRSTDGPERGACYQSAQRAYEQLSTMRFEPKSIMPVVSKVLQGKTFVAMAQIENAKDNFNHAEVCFREALKRAMGEDHAAITEEQVNESALKQNPPVAAMALRELGKLYFSRAMLSFSYRDDSYIQDLHKAENYLMAARASDPSYGPAAYTLARLLTQKRKGMKSPEDGSPIVVYDPDTVGSLLELAINERPLYARKVRPLVDQKDILDWWNSCHNSERLTNIVFSVVQDASGLKLKGEIDSSLSVLLSQCNMLTRLSLKRSSFKTEGLLKEIVDCGFAKRLQRLNLTSCQITSDDIKVVMERCISLSKLILDQVEAVNKDFLAAMVYAEAPVGSLTRLSLEACQNVDNEALAALAQYTKLTSLRLTRCDNVNVEGVLVVLRASPNMRKLGLYTSASDADLPVILQALPTLTCIDGLKSGVTVVPTASLFKAHPSLSSARSSSGTPFVSIPAQRLEARLPMQMNLIGPPIPFFFMTGDRVGESVANIFKIQDGNGMTPTTWRICIRKKHKLASFRHTAEGHTHGGHENIVMAEVAKTSMGGIKDTYKINLFDGSTRTLAASLELMTGAIGTSILYRFTFLGISYALLGTSMSMGGRKTYTIKGSCDDVPAFNMSFQHSNFVYIQLTAPTNLLGVLLAWIMVHYKFG